jgi:hypothetical protein
MNKLDEDKIRKGGVIPPSDLPKPKIEIVQVTKINGKKVSGDKYVIKHIE